MTKTFQILVIGSFIFLVSSVCAQEPKLIEAAKKEAGKIVAYGSLESDTTEAVKKAFEKKTGLSMEYWRASATKVVDRATSEFRAQKPLFDVVLVHDAEMRLLLKNNVISRYNSPAFKDFTKESIDADLGRDTATPSLESSTTSQ